jgi:molybdopterin-guanine dinucleotide biosynthesis protein A
MVNTAVILAGGKSVRFGCPKGLATVCGRSIIDKLIEDIRAARIDNIYLSISEPDLYPGMELPVIRDRYISKDLLLWEASNAL